MFAVVPDNALNQIAHN